MNAWILWKRELSGSKLDCYVMMALSQKQLNGSLSLWPHKIKPRLKSYYCIHSFVRLVTYHVLCYCLASLPFACATQLWINHWHLVAHSPLTSRCSPSSSACLCSHWSDHDNLLMKFCLSKSIIFSILNHQRQQLCLACNFHLASSLTSCWLDMHLAWNRLTLMHEALKSMTDRRCWGA